MTNPTNSVKNIVLLEDDENFAFSIRRELIHQGYAVHHFKKGRDCIDHLMQNTPDACLFDWNLPDMNGDQVMAVLAQAQRLPPVIFLSSNDHEETISNILLAGADDYVVKPPSPSILRARIESLLRRSSMRKTTVPVENVGDLVIDYEKNTISRGGQHIALTGYELMIAIELFKKRGQIISRAALYDLLGIADMAVDTRRLDVHISHLRRKLGLHAMNGWKLSSVYQRGYRLEYLGTA